MKNIDVEEKTSELEERVSELKRLIESDELKSATNRLLDFVDDFSTKPETMHEAINYSANFKNIAKQDRNFGMNNDLNNRKSELRLAILNFIDVIKEDHEKEVNDDFIKTKFDDDILGNNPVSSWSIIENHNENNDFSTNFSFEDAVFEGRKISKTYKKKGSFKLHPVDVQLKLCKITAVIGENGNGKTTLLRIIAGLLNKTSGEISYPYLTLNQNKSYYHIKQQIAYIPQELPHWDGSLADNLRFSASIHGIKGNRPEVDKIIARLDLDKYKHAKWNEISSGYKMRFSLAKALIWHPKLLILDEPLANLDVNTKMDFLENLRDLANSYKNPMSVIISSQDVYEVEGIADNVIFIKDGKVLRNVSLVDFDEKRKENSFEISTNISKRNLLEHFNDIENLRIEKAGKNFILHTSIKVTKNVFLQLIVEKNIELNYFRDISKSTRKLFNV